MPEIKLINIVGARPQIIKASAISRAIRLHFSDRITELTIHTGQHYDKELSDVFFDELEIHKPDYNLGVGSSSHGRQTSMMITGIEEVLLSEKPDCVVLYGDTNSTLAGALAAVKLHFPVIHIEAGLRSFNKIMPEELNRIVSDHASTLLFAPTNDAFKNLMREGFRPENSPPYTVDNPKIYLTGDIMYDNTLFFAELAEKKKASFLDDLGVTRDNYILTTIHRDINTDNIKRLETILSTLKSLAEEHSIRFVMPLHPRTTNSLKMHLEPFCNDLYNCEFVKIIPPVSFLEMTILEKTAKMIITDSGGVQKESHFFRKPCLVLRKETEWIELVNNGTAVLVDADQEKIRIEFNRFIKDDLNFDYPGFYGNGKAAEFILNEILMMFES
ncbi:MAG: UDP-N-acetylglucosamine 2-epimerase (non-hydrolyzing) [Bacteroidales bacterium]|jgi:UDP-GlcNAc3NAcA epimerase|nr:UDP-N-acetylglucosamine 2-epimerase (non-hydrolyzing) [Bacteroidales bacterium]OQB64817.1 MAG: UDP-2,3-diacetamido-2,3-dideoxy-D-glucuronate 2-epimerase [Bacteroidetes bacterium ADurb.Bin145]HOU03052.1 UDP-N-acetylglucosamine 2-epimerase (non-hydrolyzing) [Bacteroidales bacterium]HQK66777.1 UDP-N-acetylglucosamine 2-epimerase (non-hydrolyzing) [Bacteroidales bacterium]